MTDDRPVDYVKLSTLYEKLLDARAHETAARETRVKLEEQIAALVPGKDDGQVTVSLDGTPKGGRRITVKRGLKYAADFTALEEAFNEQTRKEPIPAPIKLKTTREVDVPGYKWVLENAPQTLVRAMQEAVTISPRKVAVEVK